MKIERVEILPYARSPVGSFAIVKLHGISRLVGPPLFKLEPAERAQDAAAYGWPKGDIKPLGVRAGPRSVEFLIGPEIVKAAALKPGTRVRFRMASANADLQFEWPSLPGDKRAESKSLSTSLVAAQSQSQEPQPDARTKPSTPHLAGSTEPAAIPLAARAQREPAALRERGLARLQARQPKAEIEAPPASHRPPPLPPSPPPLRSHVGWRARVEAEQAAKARAHPRSGSMLLPLALGFVIVFAMGIHFVRTTNAPGPNDTLFSVLRAVQLQRADQPPPSLAKATAVLSEILGVSDTSPSGIAATGARRREALERANDLLHSAQTPRERAEAAFWLRKALADSFAEPRLLWSVTQLGSAYAASDEQNAPNYQAAHLLWTWAADAGDAHAACFVARLHELGLGVPKDLERARQNYRRAGLLGGCPGLREARLRLGK